MKSHTIQNTNNISNSNLPRPLSENTTQKKSAVDMNNNRPELSRPQSEPINDEKQIPAISSEKAKTNVNTISKIRKYDIASGTSQNVLNKNHGYNSKTLPSPYSSQKTREKIPNNAKQHSPEIVRSQSVCEVSPPNSKSQNENERPPSEPTKVLKQDDTPVIIQANAATFRRYPTRRSLQTSSNKSSKQQTPQEITKENNPISSNQTSSSINLDNIHNKQMGKTSTSNNVEPSNNQKPLSPLAIRITVDPEAKLTSENKSDIQNIPCSDQPILPINISSPHNTLNDDQKNLMLQAIDIFFNVWINDFTNLADIPLDLKLSELERIQQLISTVLKGENVKYSNNEYAGEVNSEGLKVLNKKINSLITSPEEFLKKNVDQLKITKGNGIELRQLMLNRLTSLLNHAIETTKQIQSNIKKESGLRALIFMNSSQISNVPSGCYSENNLSSMHALGKAYPSGVADAKMDKTLMFQGGEQATAETMKKLEEMSEEMKTMSEGFNAIRGERQSQRKQIKRLEQEKKDLEAINEQVIGENVSLRVWNFFNSWLKDFENLPFSYSRKISDLKKISRSIQYTTDSTAQFSDSDSSGDESDETQAKTNYSEEICQQESNLFQDLIKSPKKILSNMSVNVNPDYGEREILSCLKNLITAQIDVYRMVANDKTQNQGTGNINTLETIKQSCIKQMEDMKNDYNKKVSGLFNEIAELNTTRDRLDDECKTIHIELDRTVKENTSLKKENKELREFIEKNKNPLIRDADALIDQEPSEDKTILKDIIAKLLNALEEKKIGQNSSYERAGVKLLIGQLYLKQSDYLAAQKHFNDNEVMGFYKTLANEGLFYTYIGQIEESLDLNDNAHAPTPKSMNENSPLPNLTKLLLEKAEKILKDGAANFGEDRYQILTEIVNFVKSLLPLINDVRTYKESLEKDDNGCLSWFFKKHCPERKSQVKEIFNIIMTYFFNPYLIVEKILVMSKTAYRGLLGRSELFDKIYKNLQTGGVIDAQGMMNSKIKQTKTLWAFFDQEVKKEIESNIIFHYPENSELKPSEPNLTNS